MIISSETHTLTVNGFVFDFVAQELHTRIGDCVTHGWC